MKKTDEPGYIERSLSEIFKVIFDKKYFLITSIASGLLVGLLISINLPNIYKTHTILLPNEEEDSNISNTLNSYSGFANLAGISMPQKQTTQATLALEIIKSKDFLQDFLNEDDLISLFVIKSWDFESQKPLYYSSIYDFENKLWVRDVSPPYKSKPSLLESHEKFNEEVLDIYQDETTGLVHLSISHPSPQIAKEWAEKIILMVNEKIRLRDIEEAQNSVNFLNDEFSKTELNELRLVLSQLIQKEISKISLANAKLDYVFTVVDPPFLPEFKSSPNRILITFLSTFLFFCIGILIVLFRKFLI